jgi:hypothetical protein
MKCAFVGFLVLSLVSTIVFGQTANQKRKRGTSKPGTLATNPARDQTVRICQGVPIPEGYIIIAYANSSLCPHGAYQSSLHEVEELVHSSTRCSTTQRISWTPKQERIPR